MSRLRGRALQAIREQHFRLHPLCVRCQAKSPRRVSIATELDHIVALTNGGKDFDVDGGSNRQGLCEPCHAEKTAEDLGYQHRPAIGADGYPVDSACS